ncbi:MULTISPECIES: hypothetical protein [Legionella]|uniref:Outer membrane protein beta-barrel domain-containing protein n=1 Tax=Legionella maceachernii TaxID=466 RepID=A0A0W0VX84_9GAMM|nr:hypothetical protein [Legionella maceachernii]KTD24680.1 hypothetical protein Lmac_2767 [Legionella maceachernii]SKA26514.1 hypothetical protein SAMN02745128_02901 [Legionella maceachernii]SUP01890.1 Uncharacterised protein [Legionella maceachernii]
MIQRMCLMTIGCFLSFNVFANSYLPPESLDNRWTLVASLGYSDYQHMHRSEGQTAVGRLALAAELLTATQANFGLEVGVQTGNRMRFAIPQGPIAALGYAVQTTMRPMFDLLVTANANPLTESLLFTQLKGGIAYRYWQINSFRINNKAEIAGEVQAGFGYPLTEITNLNLLYQGVFGSNPRFHVHPFPESGSVSNIPIQHGVLLGLSIIA